MATEDKVDSRHEEYTRFSPMWAKCRDVIAGSERVKGKGSLYLPMLSEQTAEDYKSYRQRAMFFEATSRTLDALVGALFRKPPEFGTDDAAADILKEMRPDSMPMESFLRERVAFELLSTGRVGLLVDVESDGSGEPYLACYTAESIVNWRVDSSDGMRSLDMVVLREEHEDWSGKMYRAEKQVFYRVLRMVDGVYQQHLFRQLKDNKFELVTETRPTQQGRALDFIPFVFINHRGLGTETLRPPLLGLANVNLSHYQNSADLEHGRHFTGLPTVWVAGFDQSLKGKLQIGSQTAWVTSNADGKAGYLEFTGQGLKALEVALEQKEKLMAILGARLLEAPKNVSESAENQKLRRVGESNVLSSMADAISDGVNDALAIYSEWANTQKELTVTIVKDFVSVEANPQVLAQMVAMFQGGIISHQTMYNHLQRVELASEGIEFDEELSRIELSDPDMPGLPFNVNRGGAPQGGNEDDR